MVVLPRAEASRASDTIKNLKTLYVQLKSVKAAHIDTDQCYVLKVVRMKEGVFQLLAPAKFDFTSWENNACN